MRIPRFLFVSPVLGTTRVPADIEIRYPLIVGEEGGMEISVGLDTVPAPRRFSFATGSASVELNAPSPDHFMSTLSILSSDGSPVHDIVLSDTSRRPFLYSFGAYSGTIGAMYGSTFSTVARNFLLVPDAPDHTSIRSFNMIVEPHDPSLYCFDNEMVYVNATLEPVNDEEHSMTIHVGVSLEPTSDTSRIFDIHNDTTIYSGQYEIHTESEFDSIPSEIFTVILIAIRSATGISGSGDIINLTECESFIDELPSIRFTVMDNSANIGVYVVLSPRDYTDISEDGGVCKLRLRRSNNYVRDRLGVNFLERVAVLVDYTNTRFGFCEPL